MCIEWWFDLILGLLDINFPFVTFLEQSPEKKRNLIRIEHDFISLDANCKDFDINKPILFIVMRGINRLK